MWSLSECIPWMTVGLAECVAIVTLNLCTIIVFITNRNLRKRSTYLVINLAVIDMLAGGSAVYHLFYWVGADCNVWKWHSIEGWGYYLLKVFIPLFATGSLTNITVISLERLHATYWPFRHRVVRKRIYGLIVTFVWVISGLIVSTLLCFEKLVSFEYVFYLWNVFHGVCLLVISVCYSSILIKVRCGAQPQHHGAASRERKLTMTLLIVTVVSLLLYLPYVILGFLILSSNFDLWLSFPFSVRFHLDYALLVLFYANSLVNPILYAIRMPEYRSAVLALFRKRPQQQTQVADLPLRDM